MAATSTAAPSSPLSDVAHLPAAGEEEAMSFSTHTADAPWTVVKSNDRKRARLEAMRHVLHRMFYDDKDPEVVTVPDPLLVGSASEVVADEDGTGPLFPTV